VESFEVKVKGRPHMNYYYIVVPLVQIRKLRLKHKKPIKVTITKNNFSTTFVTNVNLDIRNGKMKRAKVHINKYVRKILDIKFMDKVIVKVEKPEFIVYRPKKIFKNRRIDFLAFVPNSILVTKNNCNLVLWRRPRARSVEIQRFLDIEISARFFGLLFSEGQKCKNTTGAFVSISNKNINPHIIVVNFLKDLFGHDKLIQAYCSYNPELDNQILENKIRAYEETVGIPIKPIKAGRHGDYCFITNVNSTLVGEIILSGLNSICDVILSNKIFDGGLKQFIKNFIIEEIFGDGYLNISNSGVSLKICDDNEKRRKVISDIFNKLGLEVNDDGKLMVCCDVTGVDKRTKLLSLDILKEKNRNKLIKSFLNLKFFNLQMKRLETLLKFKEFDNKTVCKIFGWSPNKATKWLVCMLKRGNIERIRRENKSVFYSIKITNNLKNYLELEEMKNNL